jgi:hypothetical protein
MPALLLVVAVVATQSRAQAEPCPAPQVSSFWQQLDQLCTSARPLSDAAGSAQAGPGQIGAFAEVLAYCNAPAGSRLEPAFAALPEVERMAALARAASQLGASPVAVALQQVHSSTLAPALAQQLAPDARLATGAGTDVLVRELQTAVCDDPALSQALPHTCAPLAAENTLIELRDRLLKDVLSLALKAAPANAGETAQLPALRLVAAILATALESADTRPSSLGAWQLLFRASGRPAQPALPTGLPCHSSPCRATPSTSLQGSWRLWPRTGCRCLGRLSTTLASSSVC